MSSDEWQIEEHVFDEAGNTIEVRDSETQIETIKPLQPFIADECNLSFAFHFF